MEATAVSLARSVLDGALSSAGSAVADEVARLLGVPKEVEFIRDELAMMKSFLMEASGQYSGVNGRKETVRTWVKQVRNLAYDVEDCLLDFSLYAATHSSSWWLPGSLAARHRIAARIRDLKAIVVELNERNRRYHLVGFTAGEDRADRQPAVQAQPDDDVHSVELAFQEWDIIGRIREKKELSALVSGRGDGALTVVSVWGMGGMGKSSLVRMVRNDPAHLDVFDIGTWVTVPHPLEGAEEFRRRLRDRFGLGSTADVPEYLRDKRFVIVVDDVLSQDEWEHIWKALSFPNNKGSSIIVTTRREDVARHCASHGVLQDNGSPPVYELKPLDKDESRNLLCRKVYKTTTLPEEMAEQANDILKTCRGLPLAIATIGGLLANRPKTAMEWMKLHEYIGAELESDLRNIPKVIVSSYDGLPYHLKSIFLYLCIFPENQEIRYTRLLRRWMAEGYIAKNRDMPVEVVGERFYNELISRSMIQPSKKNSAGMRVVRCRIHSMMRQIIMSKSIEENQLFLINSNFNEVPQSKIRHLVVSVSKWKKKNKRLQNINLSYVRSLTVFGEFPLSLISPKLKLLRVLDLEDTTNVKNEDLRHIGELRHLRYFSLRGTKISVLPSSLNNLHYLETLDIQDTQVKQLPHGIVQLRKLRYLLAGVSFSKKMARLDMENQRANLLGNMAGCISCNSKYYCQISSIGRLGVEVPDGINKLRDLQMLGVFNVGLGNGVAGRIKKLTNLQRLGVTCLTQEEGEKLCKSIEKLSRLERLEVRSDSLRFLTTMNESATPKHLSSLRLYGNLTILPEWICSLKDLTKVKLLGTQLQQGQVELLGGLCNLASLGLWENSYVGNSLRFGDDKFQKLKLLDIDWLCDLEKVEIQNNTLPELEKLSLKKCEALHDSDDGLSGVPYLRNLNDLHLKECGDKKELMKILQRQVIEHSKRPLLFIGSILPTIPEPTMKEADEQ